jgi:DNA-binding response OmpR family regulator
MRILVIEDDHKVANFIASGLGQEGFAVDVLHEGTDAGAQALAYDYDAVVLDLMLPGRSGFQVLRDIRARKATLPILILTAKDSVEERVAGLDSGADDYMVKPFALAELSARLRAVLRRGAARENTLRVADLEVDTVRRLVRRAGRALELKPKEYALLEFLMRNSDRPVTKSLIIEHVWNIHFDSVSNVVEVHVNALRNKIARCSTRSAEWGTSSPATRRTNDARAAHTAHGLLHRRLRPAPDVPGGGLVPGARTAAGFRRDGQSHRADQRAPRLPALREREA